MKICAFCNYVSDVSDSYCQNCGSSFLSSIANIYSETMTSGVKQLKDVSAVSRNNNQEMLIRYDSVSYRKILKKFYDTIAFQSPYRERREYMGEPLGVFVANYNPIMLRYNLMNQPIQDPDAFETISRRANQRAFDYLIPYIWKFEDYTPSVRETDIEWAIRNFEEVIRSDDFHEFDGTYLNIGVCYLLINQNTKSMKNFIEQLEITPEDETTKYMVGMNFAVSGKYEEAQQLIEEVESDFANHDFYLTHPYWYRLKSFVTKQLGDVELGKRYFDLYKQLFGDYPYKVQK